MNKKRVCLRKRESVEENTLTKKKEKNKEKRHLLPNFSLSQKEEKKEV